MRVRADVARDDVLQRRERIPASFELGEAWIVEPAETALARGTVARDVAVRRDDAVGLLEDDGVIARGYYAPAL